MNAVFKLAFTSDRSGNYDIWTMNSDGTGLTNLTNNAAKDYAPAWSPDGAKIAFTSLRTGILQIHVMNADGSAVSNISNSVSPDDQAAWSPDGTRIAFTSDRVDNASCPVFWDCTKVFVMNANGSAQTRLTNSYKDAGPAWSPNGTTIGYSSERTGSVGSGDRQIFVMNADGTGDSQLTNTGSNNSGPVYSPDGSKIAFQGVSGGKYSIFVMNVDGTSQTRLTSGTTNDLWPAWSPDGTKIAFGSDRDGNFEIYVMNADGSNQTRITHDPAADLEPKWSATVAAQSISFTSTVPSPAYVGAVYAVSATATSGLDVTFSTSTPAICSVSGSAVGFIAAGNCVVVADQAGNAAYLAAPQVTQSISVVRRPQTIAFTSVAPMLPLIGASYAVAAAASSGLPVRIMSVTPATCTVAGGTVTFLRPEHVRLRLTRVATRHTSPPPR